MIEIQNKEKFDKLVKDSHSINLVIDCLILGMIGSSSDMKLNVVRTTLNFPRRFTETLVEIHLISEE